MKVKFQNHNSTERTSPQGSQPTTTPAQAKKTNGYQRDNLLNITPSFFLPLITYQEGKHNIQ